MDVKSYCDNARIELTGWKAKLYDITHRFDDLATGDKEKATPIINHLHIVLTDLSDRIDQLQKECPTEWSPDREAIEGKVQELQRGWNEVWKTLPPSSNWKAKPGRLPDIAIPANHHL